jgi:hypothetical protein
MLSGNALLSERLAARIPTLAAPDKAGVARQRASGLPESMEYVAVDLGPEEAARVHAQAVVAGDIGTTVLGMTPEGFAKAMQLGNTTWIYFGSEVRPAAMARTAPSTSRIRRTRAPSPCATASAASTASERWSISSGWARSEDLTPNSRTATH